MSRPLSNEIDPRVQRALTEQLYGSGVPMVLTSIASGAFVAWAVWWLTGELQPLLWLLCVAVVGGSRVFLVRAYRVSAERDDSVRWLRRFTIQAGAYGLTWGLGGFAMMEYGREVRLFLVVVFVTKALGALIAMYAHPRAFFAFFIPLALPVIGYLVAAADPLDRFQGLISASFLPACAIAVVRIHALLRETLRTRVEKEDLAQRVVDEKDRALSAKAEAERATLAKTRFLAAASHDLRQPLHAQMLFIGALRAHVHDDSHGLALANRLETTSKALQSLLDGLLDISRLDAGAVTPEFTPFALQPLLDQIHLELSEQAASKGLLFRVAPTSLWARADREITLRVLRNLATNAVHYTDEGAVLMGVRRGTPLRLFVCDTGPGIAEADQQIIFEEFVQLANPERDRSKGIGLGLAIVRRLGDLLSSEVGLRSNLGRGSTFWMTLEAVEARPAPVADVTTARDSETVLRGKRVLVIDDELDVRDAMSMLLGDWGCEVECADSGAQAVAGLSGAPHPDILIVDYRLRAGETGQDAIRSVRDASGRRIPAILVTGDTDPARVAQAHSAGESVLHKPVPPETLREALVAALAPRR